LWVRRIAEDDVGSSTGDRCNEENSQEMVGIHDLAGSQEAHYDDDIKAST
jgi:hypothetical protein